MSRITRAFENKKALIAFIMGGDPDIATTESLIRAMAEAGADLIEIGIPFSDPVADCAAIQDAAGRALRGGTTVGRLFDMLKRVRASVDVPLLFMTYLNPVYAYGKERFMRDCAEGGIDGIIVPDMPFEERGELSNECEMYGIDLIPFIAPSSAGRVSMIAGAAKGFAYCTGGAQELLNQAAIPCAVGFSGGDVPSADGVIIESAVVELVGMYGCDCVESVKEYIGRVKDML